MTATTYNPATTSTYSVFQAVDITDGPGAWPGHPPMPKNFALPDGTMESVTRPLITMVNPRWYFRYIRTVVESAWGRVIHMPPHSITDITADRSSVTAGTIAAWGLFFARPENQHLKINAYTVNDERNVRPQPKGILRYQNKETVGQCRTAVWPVVDADYAIPLGSWNMSDGSVIFNTGDNYYQIENNSDQEQAMIFISSTRASDIDRVLEQPNGRVKLR
jgi:hypothetical protein